jgi:hypothetical protein
VLASALWSVKHSKHSAISRMRQRECLNVSRDGAGVTGILYL